VQDPVNLEVYEGHVYFDADSSGKYVSSDPIKDPARLIDERVQPFLDWLSANGKRGAIGEWGVPSDDARWFSGVNRMLELSQGNCLPTYVWAGGNWSPGYKLSLEPLKGIHRILTTHLAGALERNAQ
jgi:endoglucanase